jgi:hypothetical protein
VAEDNNKDRESDVATVTAADDNSNINSGSRGDDDNGGSGESNGKKNYNQLTANSCSGRSNDCRGRGGGQ